MSVPRSTPGQPEQLEEIVSYLDGELSAEENASVEQRLATDEAFRQELQSIDRAWAVLDELPLATVADRFSKTTMKLVVQNARSEVGHQTLALPLQKRKRNLRDVLLVATAVLLGGLVFRVSWKNPNRPLLADLAVIQNVDAYVQFRDVEFLRQLNRRVPSDAWPDEGDQLAEKTRASGLSVSVEDPQEWLENLAEEDRLALRTKYNRFRALPAERQERLRELHQEISAEKNAAQLRQTMLLYQQWLNSLPASEQYELRELSSEKRVNRILGMLRQLATSKSLELTPEELQLFFQQVKARLEQERAKLLKKMTPRERVEFEAKPVYEQRKYLVRKLMRDSGRGGERFGIFVRDLIPEGKRQVFRKLSPEEKRRRFASWLGEAVMLEGGNHPRRRKHFGGEIPEQELEKFFAAELDATTIEHLLALPRDKMQRQLERRYRGGMSPADWGEFIDRDHGPPRRHPPRAGEGRRRDGPVGRPRPHSRHGDRPGPPDDRSLGRPAFDRNGREQDHR